MGCVGVCGYVKSVCVEEMNNCGEQIMEKNGGEVDAVNVRRLRTEIFICESQRVYANTPHESSPLSARCKSEMQPYFNPSYGSK